jgi:pimeloyl-[acyl-carrier protein] synthase
MAKPTLDIYFNPFDPAFRANPYPFYHQLLEGPPKLFNLMMPFAIVSRYEHASQILRDHARFNSKRPMIPGLEDFDPVGGAQTVLFSDPPAHTRLRRLITGAFTPRRVRELEPRIREITNELLDKVAKAGEFEAMTDFAGPLPMRVIAELLGVPADHYAMFKAWSDKIVGTAGEGLAPGMGLDPRAKEAVAALRGYLTNEIEKRRVERGQDLISALVAAEQDAEALTANELLAFVVLLLLAGNETTTNLIANGLLALCRNPEQLERLRAEPALISTAIEEMLRYDSPAQGTIRYVTENTEIGGTEIDAGSWAMVLMAAANRDPAHFPEPDVFDVARQPNEHLAFGEGIHFCVGASLARLEGAIAISAILERFPRLRLKDSNRQPIYRSFFLRALNELPLSIN